MRRISLENTPNQEFNVTLDEKRYTISIREGRSGVMVASVNIDGESIISGLRCLPNMVLLPFRYIEHGNFIFTTQNGEYPHWTKFGRTQRFLYVTREEVEADINGI